MERQQIAEEVQTHDQESLRLRRTLNALAPINQLPPEVLSHIFLLYAADVQEQQFTNFYLGHYRNYETDSHKPLYTWHRVAQVCQSWRQVALKCASFWRCLVIDERVPEDILKKFLKRSRETPLTVIAHLIHQHRRPHCDACVGDEAASNLNAGVRVLGEVTGRMSQLNLYLCNVRYRAVWARLLGSGRHLTSLHIEAVMDASYGESALDYHGTPSVVVPDDLFVEQRAPLRSLSFHGVQLTWSNTLFSSTLRRLNIAQCLVVSGKERAADIGDLLNTLRSTPNLEALAIDVLPNARAHGEYLPVDLPRLRQLCVPNTHNNGMFLVLHLRFPHHAAIRFASAKAGTFSAEILTGYADGLPRLLNGMQVYAISHHSKDKHTQSWPEFKLWARMQDPQERSEASTAYSEETSWEEISVTPPRLRIDCPLNIGLVQALLLRLNLQHLRVLSVAPKSVEDRLWADVFSLATHITSLRVQGHASVALGATLVRWKRPVRRARPRRSRRDHVGFGALPDREDDPRSEDGYDPGPPLFPLLRTLRIAAVDFPLEHPACGRPYRGSLVSMLAVEDSGESDCERPPYGLEVASLLKCLRVRVKTGAAEVMRLEFERSQCWERERLAPLVQAVREVWWDGERLTPSNLGEQARVRRRADLRRFSSVGLSESDPWDSDFFTST